MSFFKHSLITLSLLLVATPAMAALEIGKPAPAFSAKDTHGKEVSLESLKGKPVILEWTNHGCPFVVKHYEPGNMQSLQKTAAEKGFTWITVNSSGKGRQGRVSDEQANKMFEKAGASPAHYIRDRDGSIGKAYGAKVTPHMYVIDAEGNLAYQGAIDSNPSADKEDIATATNYIANAMTAIEKGEAVDPAITKPYGCGVKYGNAKSNKKKSN